MLTPPESKNEPEKNFHGWRLLGILIIVIALIAAASALIDILAVNR